MPNWVKAVATVAVCWCAVKMAQVFLKMGDGSQWD